mmetsp:Transcript_33519/g.75839  ORF Transcript_33519/g.75839 Transcript_33519/m.75839 type:complete len:205 (-) Transcript_33519:123-737(-)
MAHTFDRHTRPRASALMQWEASWLMHGPATCWHVRLDAGWYPWIRTLFVMAGGKSIFPANSTDGCAPCSALNGAISASRSLSDRHMVVTRAQTREEVFTEVVVATKAVKFSKRVPTKETLKDALRISKAKSVSLPPAGIRPPRAAAARAAGETTEWAITQGKVAAVSIATVDAGVPSCSKRLSAREWALTWAASAAAMHTWLVL